MMTLRELEHWLAIQIIAYNGTAHSLTLLPPVKAEALLASPAGHGALRLSGRAQRKALGALMRRGLAEREGTGVS